MYRAQRQPLDTPLGPYAQAEGLCPFYLRIFGFSIQGRMVIGDMHMRFVLGSSSFPTTCGSHLIVCAAPIWD